MKTKLTLSIEKSVIEDAKVIAKENGSTLSSMIEKYLVEINNHKKLASSWRESEITYEKLSPEVKAKIESFKQLVGIFKPKEQDSRTYKERLAAELQKKYR